MASIWATKSSVLAPDGRGTGSAVGTLGPIVIGTALGVRVSSYVSDESVPAVFSMALKSRISICRFISPMECVSTCVSKCVSLLELGIERIKSVVLRLELRVKFERRESLPFL